MTDVTGVAISRIDASLFDDRQPDSGKRYKKNRLYDDGLPGIRWRFPHQCAHWFGMTVLFGACAHLYKFPFSEPRNDTERVRVKTITDHVRHDLAARPAGKFQFTALRNDTERVRVGTKTDHVRHDLAVGPADKFQFPDQPFKTDNHKAC